MAENYNCGVFKTQKEDALPYLEGLKFGSWGDVVKLGSEHPELGKRFRDVNVGWLLGKSGSAATKLARFSMLKTFVPHDSVHIKTGEELYERRHYIGLDIATPYMSDGFAVSTGNMPPESQQPSHYHITKPEVIIPIVPLWVTVIRPQTGEGYSQLASPGQFAFIGPNTYHTLTNPTGGYCPHLCLKYPETVEWKDWHRSLPNDAQLDLSVATVSGHETFTHEYGGNEIAARLCFATKNSIFEPSKFGYLAFAQRQEAYDTNVGAGEFLVIPPSEQEAVITEDDLRGYRDELIVFQRTA